MTQSLRERAQAAAKLTVLSVDTPDLGKVHYRLLSVAEVDLNLNDKEVEKDKNRRLTRSFARIVCESDGMLSFDADNETDLAIIGKIPNRSVLKVLKASNEETGVVDEDLGN